MSWMSIHSFCVGDETRLYELIKSVYDEFVAPDYTPHGNAFFYTFIEPSNFVQRYSVTKNIILKAIADSRIVGMIEIRDVNTVSLLFVKKEFQRRGVAKALFEEALRLIRVRNPRLNEISVHASPFSIPVYEKLGFVGVGEQLEENGIIYLPMKKKLF